MSASGDAPTSGAGESYNISKKTKALGKAFSNMDLQGHNLPPSPAPSSPRNGRKYAMATELVFTDNGDQHHASSMPIYQVSPCWNPDSYREDGIAEVVLKAILSKGSDLEDQSTNLQLRLVCNLQTDVCSRRRG